MANSVYAIYKGINTPIEFRGLKEEKISSVAYSVGYERHQSFTLEFKKREG
jgi:AraC-like DNA-binding protein